MSNNSADDKYSFPFPWLLVASLMIGAAFIAQGRDSMIRTFPDWFQGWGVVIYNSGFVLTAIVAGLSLALGIAVWEAVLIMFPAILSQVLLATLGLVFGDEIPSAIASGSSFLAALCLVLSFFGLFIALCLAIFRRTKFFPSH